MPQAQTCCGQPALGKRRHERTPPAFARQVVEVFEPYDHVVVPSGSCGGMIRRHYPEALADDPLGGRAEALGEKTYEITAFLADARLPAQGAHLRRTATYHDACAGLRELDVFGQPRKLLAAVDGSR